MLQSRKASGEPRPENIQKARDGMWKVPTDHVEIPAEDEEAAALALNRIGEGLYDDHILALILADIGAQGNRAGIDGFEGTGFDGDDLDDLLKRLTPLPATEPADETEVPPAGAHIMTCPSCGHQWSE